MRHLCDEEERRSDGFTRIHELEEFYELDELLSHPGRPRAKSASWRRLLLFEQGEIPMVCGKDTSVAPPSSEPARGRADVPLKRSPRIERIDGLGFDPTGSRSA